MDGPAPLHHNNPPPDLLVGDALRNRLADESAALIRRRDDLLAAEARLPVIDSEDVARKVSDFVKQIAAAAKAADGARVAAKEPYLDGGRVVDGFFKAISDPLATLKKNVERKLTEYLREKEAAERARRLQEEREARERAEAARREAEALAQSARDAESLDAAVEAEKEADRATADAIKASREADAKAADLSRTRGEFGAVASLRTHWVFDNINRDELDLEALRSHFPIDGLEKALRSFIRAGGRELKGARIYETTEANVR